MNEQSKSSRWSQAGKPITPAEADEMRKDSIPKEVINCWNQLIATRYNKGRAVVRQDEAARALAETMHITEQECFNSHYLDIEEIYQASGWIVKYDKPAYHEAYPTTFEFKKKT